MAINQNTQHENKAEAGHNPLILSFGAIGHESPRIPLKADIAPKGLKRTGEGRSLGNNTVIAVEPKKSEMKSEARRMLRRENFALRDIGHSILWAEIMSRSDKYQKAREAANIASGDEAVFLHEAADKLKIETKPFRMTVCGKAVSIHAEHAQIAVNSEGRAFWQNIALCEKPQCPVCNAKRAELIRLQIEQILNEAKAQGYFIGMLTFTLRHSQSDKLAARLEQIKAALRGLYASPAFVAARAAFGLRPSISFLEITHGDNGWHPHLHVLFLIDFQSREALRQLAEAEAEAARLRDVAERAKAEAARLATKAEVIRDVAEAARLRKDKAPKTFEKAEVQAKRAEIRAAREAAREAARLRDVAAKENEAEALRQLAEVLDEIREYTHPEALERRAATKERQAREAFAEAERLEHFAAMKLNESHTLLTVRGEAEAANEAEAEAEAASHTWPKFLRQSVQLASEAGLLKAEAALMDTEAAREAPPREVIDNYAGLLWDVVFPIWQARLADVGADCNEHGLDVRMMNNAEARLAEYLSKYGRLPEEETAKGGLSYEAAKSQTKHGRQGGRSPLDLLRACNIPSRPEGIENNLELLELYQKAEAEAEAARHLWLEFYLATDGRHFVQGQAKAAKFLGLDFDEVKEFAEIQFAALIEAGGAVEVIGTVTQEELSFLAYAGMLAEVLDIVELAEAEARPEALERAKRQAKATAPPDVWAAIVGEGGKNGL